MSQARLMFAIGRTSVAVIGGSTAAMSAATLILATGGAIALVVAGCGVYRWFCQEATGPIAHPAVASRDGDGKLENPPRARLLSLRKLCSHLPLR